MLMMKRAGYLRVSSHRTSTDNNESRRNATMRGALHPGKTAAFQPRRSRSGKTPRLPARPSPRRITLVAPRNLQTSSRVLTKEVYMSTVTPSENTFQEAATYGGLVDAIGGRSEEHTSELQSHV